jgi:SAM-dependent methyltransferase
MNKCRICFNENELDKNYSIREMMQGKGDVFNYFLCSECGCLQIIDFPENLNLYYQDYYTNERTRNELSVPKKILWDLRYFISNYKIYSLIEKIHYNSVLNWKRIARINKESKILDVGCGSGDILFEFRNHGFSNLTGIDPNLDENIKNDVIYLFRKSIFEIEEDFDFIMFNHSFEHIWDQHDTLEKAKDLLENNGVIMLRIPVINTAFYVYRENWVQIDAPRHFYLHSLESIDRLCSQHGLQIYHKYFDSSEFQFIGSEQYMKGIALHADNSYLENTKKSIFSMKDVKYFKKQAKKLNKEEKGDQVVLFIKRIGG